MAFNPFDFFRRNQKVAFAGLTIFVMFTFVLSFGQGDFFQWAQGWIGNLRHRGTEVMAKVDGRKVYDADLVKRDDSRALADQFLREALQSLNRDTDAKVRDELKTAGKPTQDAVQRFLQARASNYIPPQTMQILQMAQMGQLPPNFLDRIRAELPQQIQDQKRRTQNELRALTAAPNLSPADDAVAKSADQLMKLDNLAAQAGNGFFADPVGGKTNADRLEFDLWLRKADKLGISIRPEDAAGFVKDDFYGLLGNDVWTAVEKGFLSKPGFSRAKLQAALADEYRVRSAYRIVTGGGPPAASPYDLFRFYKEQCEAGTYQVIPVPAESFLGKVAGTPSETELRDLFDKHRSVEPDPTQERPGFRDPRRLKLAWLEVKGDEPAFQKAGEEATRLAELYARFAPLGFGVTAPLTAPAVLGLADPQLQGAYAGYRSEFEGTIRDRWFPNFIFGKSLDPRHTDTSVVRPKVAAAAVGALVGSGLTHAGPLAAAWTAEQTATHFEFEDRAKVLGFLLAPPANPLASVAAAGAAIPKPLPLDVVRQEQVAKVKVAATRHQAEADVQAFGKELARLGAKKDKSEARSLAEKFIAEHGLTAGASTAFHDVYSIDQDRGLAVLIGQKDLGHGMMNELPTKFGPRFFGIDPRRGGTPPATLTYFEPVAYPTGAPADRVQLSPFEPTYLAWRTDSLEAATPREFAAARPKVEAAWRRAKARELAKQAAEELKKRLDARFAEEKATDQPGKILQIFNDTQGQFVREKFGIDGEAVIRSFPFIVNRVAPVRPAQGGTFEVREPQPTPFTLADLTKRELPYPTEKMQAALLAAKDKPFGTTLLEADKPNDVYYVAVLANRDKFSTLTFEQNHIAEGTTPLADIIRGRELNALALKRREDAVALLKAEFRVTDESPKLKEKPSAE